MGFFSHDSDEAQAHQQVYNGEHDGSWTHELLAGAAAFEAARKYEQHVAANGAPPSHALAKELFAGFAAAEVDKLVETKGLDYIDAEKAKRQARQQAEQQITPDNYNNF